MDNWETMDDNRSHQILSRVDLQREGHFFRRLDFLSQKVTARRRKKRRMPRTREQRVRREQPTSRLMTRSCHDPCQSTACGRTSGDRSLPRCLGYQAFSNLGFGLQRVELLLHRSSRHLDFLAAARGEVAGLWFRAIAQAVRHSWLRGRKRRGRLSGLLGHRVSSSFILSICRADLHLLFIFGCGVC